MKEILFRNENYSGSGVRDAIQVMSFEMFDLNNSDIPETLQATIFAKNTVAKNYCLKLIELIESNDLDNSNKPTITKESAIIWAENLLSFIKQETGKSIKYALWLTDVTNASYGMYGTASGCLNIGDQIDAYLESDIILSNMGMQGKLYGYESLPEIHHTITVTPDVRDDQFGGDTFHIFTQMS